MHVTKFSVRLIALLAVIAAVLVAFGSVGPGAPREASAAKVGGLYTNTLADCLAVSGGPGSTEADNAGNQDGETDLAELHACVKAAPVNDKFGKAAVANDPQANVGANTRIQAPAPKAFHGLFVGTDGQKVDAGAESDPCTLETAVKQWPDWDDPSQDRVIVLDEGNVARQCPVGDEGDGSGRATKSNIKAELLVLKVKVPEVIGEFVFFISGHGGGDPDDGGPLTGSIQDDDGALITANDLAGWLSGFNKGVTLTVIIDACQSGQVLNDLKVKLAADAITDVNADAIDPANLSMLTSTDKGSCSQGLPKFTAGTSCSDIFLNIAALAGQNPDLITPGDAPASTDPIAARSITRTEPSQKKPAGGIDVVTVTYIGPDLNGDLIPDESPTELACEQKIELTKKQEFKAVVHSAFDRIDVDVVNDGVDNKLVSVEFVCQSTKESVAGVKKASIEPNPGGGFFETWSANFSTQCITEKTGVTMLSTAADQNNQFVVKDCFFTHVTTGIETGGLGVDCNQTKVDSAPIVPQVDKFTLKSVDPLNKQYNRIEVGFVREAFDRIEVDVVDDGIDNKLVSVVFECQLNGELQPGVKKASIEANPDSPTGFSETWSANFTKKCITDKSGVTMHSIAADPNNQWEIVPAGQPCRAVNTGSGYVVPCNGDKTVSVLSTTLTGAIPPGDPISVDSSAGFVVDETIVVGDEKVVIVAIDPAGADTLGVAPPVVGPFPIGTKVARQVQEDKLIIEAPKTVKSVLFQCQNSGEKEIGENKGTFNNPNNPDATFELWSADFTQKCISDKPDTGVIVTVVPNDPGKQVVLKLCFVENTDTGAVAPCNAPINPPSSPAGERGIMNPLSKFQNIGNKRPTRGAFDEATNIFSFSTCAFSESFKLWIRTDVETLILESGPGAKNFGKVVLFLGTDAPTDPQDGTSCARNDGTLIFPSILVSHTREATTDFPNEQKNIESGIPTDPDGPTKPAKGDVQVLDADTLADDWDGDGCPDWDELDKNFLNGRDPFNPTDCNQDDYTGTYNILATAFPAAKVGVVTGPLADVQSVVSKEQKFDPTADEDGAGPNTCNDGIDNGGGDGADNADASGDCLGKHVSVELKVDDDPNFLKNNQKLYWERWVYDPTNEEDANDDGPGGSCDDGKDNGLNHVPAKDPDGADEADSECYDLDPDQAGWWQVQTGSIAEQEPGVSKLVTLNRLVVPPCGVATTGLPGDAVDVDGNPVGPVTVQPTPDQLLGVQCVGDVQQGSYFQCIARVDHTNRTTTNDLDANVTCYIDAPLLSLIGPPTALPSFADGNAGAPPPPPYGTAAPQKLNGFVDEDNQQIFLRGCFKNVGGSPGPNTLVELHVDPHSLKGFTDVWFDRSIAECEAKKPNPDDAPTLQLDTELTRQPINFDHDEDGCSDYDELGNVDPPKDPPPAKKNCGNDPFNPFDSDADANGVVSVQVTVIPADVCRKGVSNQPGVAPDPCFGPDTIQGNEDDLDEGTLVAGFYFHCIAKNTQEGNDITTTAYCYTDSPALTVNCEVTGDNVGPCDVFASVCSEITGFAAASECGDGILGTGPPLPFGDVDTTHAVSISGTYDKQTNTIITDTCFENVENNIQGPNIYARTKINIHTGQGTVQIASGQDNCIKPAFEDEVEFPPVLIQTAEQPPDWDSDLDGCTNEQELGGSQGSGGLRDPFNRWDLMDMFVAGTKNKQVNIGDITALVQRFGDTDAMGTADPNRNSDPLVAPLALTGYHPSADRSPPLKGSNLHNLPGPDGQINILEITQAVKQFGNTCVIVP